MLQARLPASLLIYLLEQEVITDGFKTQAISFFFFNLLSLKKNIYIYILFASSGPKPCEACRQEEMYEEPISILNSNEVSHKERFFCPHYDDRRHPLYTYCVER